MGLHALHSMLYCWSIYAVRNIVQELIKTNVLQYCFLLKEAMGEIYIFGRDILYNMHDNIPKFYKCKQNTFWVLIWRITNIKICLLHPVCVIKYVLFCTIICIIFTSLCKNFVKLTWVLAEAFRCHGHHFQSEVKIIHIIVQDQDGQNNNITFILSSLLLCGNWILTI